MPSSSQVFDVSCSYVSLHRRFPFVSMNSMRRAEFHRPEPYPEPEFHRPEPQSSGIFLRVTQIGLRVLRVRKFTFTRMRNYA